MNYFIVSKNPTICAKVLDDARLIAACKEVTQAISDAYLYAAEIHNNKMYMHTTVFEFLTKPFNPKHPIVQWTMADVRNTTWAIDYLIALCAEYRFRFKKPHAYDSAAFVFNQYKFHMAVFIRGRSAFVWYERPVLWPNCTYDKKLGIDYSHVFDTFIAYRYYLRDKWQLQTRDPIWTGRKIPFKEHNQINGMSYFLDVPVKSLTCNYKEK